MPELLGLPLPNLGADLGFVDACFAGPSFQTKELLVVPKDFLYVLHLFFTTSTFVGFVPGTLCSHSMLFVSVGLQLVACGEKGPT